MNEKRRVLLLIVVMLVVAIGVGTTALIALYDVALTQQRTRLIEMAKSQARLIEAVARFDAQYSEYDLPGGAFEATLSQIREAHAGFDTFGETGEFNLGRHEDDQIVFLLIHRHAEMDRLNPIPFSSEIAEPMWQALQGKSGTMIGLDYRGQPVLAAFEPVRELDLGIVAKIDLDEVRAPFVKAGLLAAGGGLVLILLGVLIFLRVSNPMIRRIVESEQRYRGLFMELKEAEEGLRKARNELELRVVDRTVELAETNESLRQEINQRSLAEGASRESERSYRQLFENMGSGAAVYGVEVRDGEPRFVFQDLNSAACRMSQVEYTDVIGKDVRDVFPDVENFGLLDVLKNVYRTGAPQMHPSSNYDDERLTAWFENRVFKLPSGEVVALYDDVTDRKRIELALHDSRDLLESVVEGTTGAIFLKDTRGCYVMANSVTLRTMGKTRDEVIGADDTALFPPETARRLIQNDLEIMTTGESRSIEEIIPVEDGFNIWLTTKTPYRDADGDILGIIGVAYDVTEHKRLEAQVQQTQKMDAIGQLAGGVAHDFNNLLLVISAHAEFVASRTDPSDVRSESMSAMMTAVEEATGVVQSLLTFSRKLRVEKRPVDLCAVVDQAVKMLRRVLPARIALEVDTDCEPSPWVLADPTQLHQVILNLAVNARDAMQGGGTLRIAVTVPGDSDPAQTSIETDLPPATVVVSDTGNGLSPEIRQRIFEPFFSTKPEGQGTGLGLSIVHGIVEEHGGDIEFDSEVEVGTTFTIQFPCVAPSLSDSLDSLEGVERRGQGEVILLAEDMPQVRGVLASTLLSHGFQVIQVADGDAILEQFQLLGKEIRLFILDVDLPKRSGDACLQMIRAAGSQAPAILISADFSGLLDDEFDERTVLLPKPFSVSELGTLVIKQLDRAEEI